MRRKLITGRSVPSIFGTMSTAFLVTIVVFIGGCGEEQATSSSADEIAEQDVAEETTESTEESAEDTVASLGEPVSIGDVEWTVTDVLESDTLVSPFGAEEGNFVIVDVTFQNNSNQDLTLATPFVALLDSQGREFEADMGDNLSYLYPEEIMFVDHVQPGLTKEGKIVFSVAPDSSGLKLLVGEARFASDEHEYIDLGT